MMNYVSIYSGHDSDGTYLEERLTISIILESAAQTGKRNRQGREVAIDSVGLR